MTENIWRAIGARKLPELYAWDVRTSDAGQGGVTDDKDRAIQNVHRALRDLEPRGRGKVRRVALAPDGTPRYVDLRTVGEAWLDEATGAAVWRTG